MNRRPRNVKELPDRAAWEAVEAYRRPITHSVAVAECEELSELYRQMWKRRAVGMVNLQDVLRTLTAKKVPFVLTGAHGISAWTGRPRSTHDVDILVKGGRNYTRAVKALRELYPTLEVRQFAGVTGFFLPGDTQSLLDVTYPHREDIRETLESAVWVEDGPLRYRVPTLEAALANKYGAMVSPGRNLVKRGQDAVDFAAMVQHSADEGQKPIDLEKLAALGEKVWPGGGGAEILRLVEDVRQGKLPTVTPPEGPRG